jgi:hypothetical protein
MGRLVGHAVPQGRATLTAEVVAYAVAGAVFATRDTRVTTAVACLWLHGHMLVEHTACCLGMSPRPCITGPHHDALLLPPMAPSLQGSAGAWPGWFYVSANEERRMRQVVEHNM